MGTQPHILWELFWAFSRIGLFTIGGGLAMLPMLQKEIVEKYNWASDKEILDYFAIGQSTPGIIAINVATFIGYKKKGIIGALFATFGMVLPSWIIIILIAMFFQHFSENILIQKALLGVRIAVVVLITNAVIKMGKKSIVNSAGAVIAIIAFILIAWQGVSPIYIIIAAGLTGYVLNPNGIRGKSL